MLQSLWNKSKNGSLDKLEPAQCITDYATIIQSNRRNVLLVMNNENVDPTLDSEGHSLGHPKLRFTKNLNVYYTNQFNAGSGGIDLDLVADSYSWMCSGLGLKMNEKCAGRIGSIVPQDWSMSSTDGCWVLDKDCRRWKWRVDYCLSEPAVPRCRLYFSSVISITVTILNFCKYNTRHLGCSSLDLRIPVLLPASTRD